MSYVDPFPVDHPVIGVVVDLVAAGPWVGTAVELLVLLQAQVDEEVLPADPTRLAARLGRSHRVLELVGVTVGKRKTGRRRLLLLSAVPGPPAPAAVVVDAVEVVDVASMVERAGPVELAAFLGLDDLVDDDDGYEAYVAERFGARW